MSFKDKLKGFKDKLKAKTYQNAHVLNLTYEEKGIVKQEEVIFKKSNLPIIGDWQRIYPIVNKDDSWNLINLIFGGWKNFIKITFIMLLVIYIFFGYLGNAREYMDGNKYVIIDKESFLTYCSNNINLDTWENIVKSGNLSNMSYIKEVKNG